VDVDDVGIAVAVEILAELDRVRVGAGERRELGGEAGALGVGRRRREGGARRRLAGSCARPTGAIPVAAARAPPRRAPDATPASRARGARRRMSGTGRHPRTISCACSRGSAPRPRRPAR